MNERNLKGKDQEVFYQRLYKKDRDLQVYAQPVGTAKRTYSAGGLGQLADALSEFNNGLKEWANLQKIQQKENEVKAEADYVRGVKEKPSSFLNIGLGYDAKWETMKGIDLGIQYYNQLQSNIEARKSEIYSIDDDKERNKILAKIKEETYNSVFSGDNHSDYRLAGASDYLKYGEAYLQKTFLDASVKKEKEKRINAISSLIVDEVISNKGGDYNTPIDPIKMKTSIDELYKKIIKDNEKSLVSISRDEYSSIVIDNIGTTAIEYAKKGEIDKATDLLQVFKQKGDGGFSLDEIKDNEGKYKFRDKIYNYEQVVAHEIEKYERKLEKAQKKLEEETTKRYITEALKKTTQEDLQLLIDAAQKDNNAPLTAITTLYSLMRQEAYAQTDNNKLVEIEAKLRADDPIFRGSKGLKTLLTYTKEANFNTNDTKHALALWEQNENERKAKASVGSTKKDEDEKFYASMLDKILPSKIGGIAGKYDTEINYDKYTAIIQYHNLVKKGVSPAEAYTEVLRTLPNLKQKMREKVKETKDKLKEFYPKLSNPKDKMSTQDKKDIKMLYEQHKMYEELSK